MINRICNIKINLPSNEKHGLQRTTFSICSSWRHFMSTFTIILDVFLLFIIQKQTTAIHDKVEQFQWWWLTSFPFLFLGEIKANLICAKYKTSTTEIRFWMIFFSKIRFSALHKKLSHDLKMKACLGRTKQKENNVLNKSERNQKIWHFEIETSIIIKIEWGKNWFYTSMVFNFLLLKYRIYRR